MTKEDVLNDYKKAGYDYLKLHNQYAKTMKEELDKHGGNISDLPAEPGNVYNVTQQKLTLLHTMYVDNSLPTK